MVLPNAKHLSVLLMLFAGSGERAWIAASPPMPMAASRGAAAAASPNADACPANMVLAKGSHCRDAEQTCKRWVDPEGPYHHLRCAEYEQPSRCKGERDAMSFCIDRDEYSEDAKMPRVNVSFGEAKTICNTQGKRLCREVEWEFACEGEEMRPYPHGFSRQDRVCNIDQTNLGGPGGALRDLRAPIGSHPSCSSTFGVRDMTGNVDEWVERTGSHPSVLRGGWWLPGRNRCRAATAEHGPIYSGKQVGFRCCQDTK